MVFPLSQSGAVRCCGQHGSAHATASRIAEALRSETLEEVDVAGSVVRFRSLMGTDVPRPGGRGWLFVMYDRGTISVEGAGTLQIRYCFSTAICFREIGYISLALAVPGMIWPWPWLLISTFSFAWLFGGSYLLSRTRLPFWLRKVATAEKLPNPRKLQLDRGD